MTTLAENLEQLEEAIAAACRRAARPRAEVELMAVSKTYPAATIAEAAALGLALFGENRVQEFAGKAAALDPLRTRAANPIRVHLIGHLQSNKAQRAVELFDGIDSLDSLRLAERLNEAAGKLGKRLPVLIEVKLSPEESKAGLDPNSAEAHAGLAQVREYSGDTTQARSEAGVSLHLHSNVDAWMVLARLDLAANLLPASADDVAHALLIEPSNFAALAMRQALRQRGQTVP